MKKPITENDCRDGKKVLNYALKNGVDVRRGKGSHFIMQKNGQTETAYNGQISNGVARKIYRFFVSLSLAVALIFWLGKMFFV